MTLDIGQGRCATLEDGIVLARCIAEALMKTGDDDEDRVVMIERIGMGLNKFGKERRWRRRFDFFSTAYIVLDYCNASPKDYKCIFTSVATSSIEAGWRGLSMEPSKQFRVQQCPWDKRASCYSKLPLIVNLR
ncbi:hypothetical protein Q3G72_026846 [Acer saccharum]|nr:hypothetical protein Q3G72_026846 [Acer saccharum]